jgi:hypothetical protein
MEKLARVNSVEPLEGYKLRVTFTDGVIRVVDFQNDLKGPIFEPLKDLTLFRQVKVEAGTLVWPNGADVCPDVLYYEGIPPWAKKHLKPAPHS